MATFYIEAVENTQIALVKVGSPTIGTVKYGVNDSTCPNTYTVTTASTPISLTAGQKCYWTITSTSTDFSLSNYLKFTSTAKINVGGNLSDLIGGEMKIPRNFCFCRLFNGCANLIDASNLIVVDDFNGKTHCYRLMFYNCTSLVAAPELPATTLTDYCYTSMLSGCTSLTTAPTLPATMLADYCYQYMFSGCTSLIIAPTLPATTLASNCYQYMFQNCTSLTTPPNLPATTLTTNCYKQMFSGCTNIRLSETQTVLSYRIPSEGTGTEGTDSLTDMFASTGGTFKGTPTINTTYYLVPYATFYIEAIEDTDITLNKVGSPTVGDAGYSVNDHGVSNVYSYGDTIHLTAGQKCYWFITSTTTAFSFSNYLNFTSTAKINVGGNLSDLIGGETKLPRNYCFRGLFQNCTSLIDASNLAVVNNFNFKTYCYQYMFYNCTSLTTLPELLATTLTNNCYSSMFRGCASLSIAPTLPATTLADSCYGNMFQDCTSLTTAPELPVTTLANGCYGNMFQGCTSLTTAPELPATTLADWCYSSMFRDCKSLTTAPALPATTLTSYCYQYMFYGCIKIKLSETQTAPYSIPYRIPSEGTGTEGTDSLTNMFNYTGGTFTGTPTINTTYYLAPYATFYIEAVEDTNITLSKVGTPTVGDAYYGVENHNVPNAYTYGDTIHLTAGQKCYWFVMSTSEDFSYLNYLNFTSTAKINVGGNMSDLIGGESKIPRSYCFDGLFYNCIKLVSASNLILVNDFNSKGACYREMFQGCASLTTVPKLLATTLASGCYQQMFKGCTSLTTAPELPATTLANLCYNNMFYGCTSLTVAPELPATTLAQGCYESMFDNCTSLTTPLTLPATTLANNCYYRMFRGCTNIRLSETQTAPYLIPYRIPSEGTGTEGTSSLTSMFYNTGGTFTGTPTINTTYYLVPYATFYIEAVEDTDITLSKVGSPTVGDACYGIDDHGVPNAYTYGDTIHLTAGQKCYWFITSTTTAFNTSNYLNFTSTAKINVGGNMSDLIGGESKIPRNYCFCNLFYRCTTIVDASNLIVVNDFNSKSSCYQAMFGYCASLTAAPELPATTLSNYCYYFIFGECTSLTTAPALPATTLAQYCYYQMFEGCTSLATAPELPATTLADCCYQSMFQNCTSLTTPPALPATTLETQCYYNMFYGCTSLTTTPELPATTLANSCYSYMFRSCRSLTTPPALLVTTLTNSCYNRMFSDCTNIKLSETQTAPYSIPYRIPSEGTGTIGTSSLDDMFTNTGGTFKGTPTINKTYYLAPPSSPIYITYKGQELANFESGSKTLKCGGKYMEGDVIIAREIGTNNVVVLYNSGTILTFQNGTKTLKCAGKGMATDLVIQTS